MYIDNNPAMLEEFQWIYKSWIYSGVWQRSDLIAVCHPEMFSHLPSDDPNVFRIIAEPLSHAGSKWEGYPFINSIGCLTGERVAHLSGKYKWLLRTDADVFLTRNMAHFRPSFPVLGRGRYAENADVWSHMVAFCEAHGVEHKRVFGCGHSIMAESSLVLFFLERQMYWCERLLEHFSHFGQGAWPGWFRGVLTMYAGEIAANENYDAFCSHSYQRILDLESYVTEPIDGLTLHIHAIHTDTYFSKHRYRNGEYSHISRKDLDRKRVNQYAHWIVDSPIDEIKRDCSYPY